MDWWRFFFFKQKTAYEMRISDWSSDVCSSDLLVFGQNDWQRNSHLAAFDLETGKEVWRVPREEGMAWASPSVITSGSSALLIVNKIGRAACRERVCQYV